MPDRLYDRGVNIDLYEPAEDSFLLAGVCVDAIEGDERVLDVGTGTGFVAARIREERGAEVVGIDLNPTACQRAHESGIPVVRGDLLAPFAANSFDVVTCNPPYLPTEPDEERDDWLSVAVSGGETGRTVVEALFTDLDRVLRTPGRCYLLVSSLMDVDAVAATAQAHGFAVAEIDRDDSFPFEVLSVLCVTRTHGAD